MGKRAPVVAPPSGKKPAAAIPLFGWIALAVIGVLVVVIAVLLYLNYERSQRELPAVPEMHLPDLPKGPELPQKQVDDIQAPSLPQVSVKAPPSTPVSQANPQPEKKEPSGTVTWQWQLYQIPLTFVVTVPTPGYQTVALGISVWNDSTENVPVGNDHNEFTVNADNRIYQSEIWSTASAVFGGLPYMVPTTLAPGGRFGGYTVYMIPEKFNRVMAYWQLNLPASVRVVRVDPKVAVIPSAQPQPQPQFKLPGED